MARIVNSFTATGASSKVLGTDAEMFIGGTFTATVALEGALPDPATGADVWVQLAVLTGPGAVRWAGAADRAFRIECTSYTSGTVIYDLNSTYNEDYLRTV